MRKKRHGKALLLVLLSVSDYKRLDRSSNFSIPHGAWTSGKCQPWHEFCNISTIRNNRRRKGRSRRRPWPLPTFWNFTFSYYNFSKKDYLLSFEWTKIYFTILPTLQKPMASPGNSTIAPHLNKIFRRPCTLHLIKHGQLVNHSALIRFDQIMQYSRYRYRWFALKYFCVIHIKSLTALKIFGGTFGIGGRGNCPHWPPLATNPGIDVFDETYNLISLFSHFCYFYQHAKGLSAATDNIRCKCNTPFANCPFMDFTVG